MNGRRVGCTYVIYVTSKLGSVEEQMERMYQLLATAHNRRSSFERDFCFLNFIFFEIKEISRYIMANRTPMTPDWFRCPEPRSPSYRVNLNFLYE